MTILLARGAGFFPSPETSQVLVRMRANSKPASRRLLAEVPELIRIARTPKDVAQVISVARGRQFARVRLRVMLAGRPSVPAAARWITDFEREAVTSGLSGVQLQSTLPAFPGAGPAYRHAPLRQALERQIGIQVTGPFGPGLTGTADRVAHLLRGLPQMRDVWLTSAAVANDPVLHLDKVLAAERGVSEAQVAGALRVAHGGLVVGTILEGDRRRSIRVVLPPSSGSAARLPRLLLKGETRTRRAVYLGDVATVGFVQEMAEYRRDRGQPVIGVTGVLGSRASGSDIRLLKQGVARLRLPAGYRLSFTGVPAATRGLAREMTTVALLALLLIAVALLWRYHGVRRPLMILLCLPYAVAGSLVALGLGRSELCAPGWVGLLLAAAITIGLAVTLIDRMDCDLPHGRGRRLVLVAAGLRARSAVLRPAACALAGGVLLAVAGGAEFGLLWPLAAALLGGVSAGAVATILWIPPLRNILIRSHNVVSPESGTDASSSSGMAAE